MGQISLQALAVTLILLAASAAMAGEVAVLFDQGHDQRFLIDGDGPLQLSNLASIFGGQGLQLKSSTSTLTKETLHGFDALVISGAFQALAPAEIESILDFVKTGGRLSVMLHAGPPLAGLLRRLGVSISNGVIQETDGIIGDDPINFTVKHLKRNPLFEGIDFFSMYGVWALLATNDRVDSVASTGSLAWIDLNGDLDFGEGDAVQQFTVVLEGSWGNGRFLVFGDDALFQNQFLTGNNRKLAENLARWLSGAAAAPKPQIAP